MEYRFLGASGVRVSELAIGTLTFGQPGNSKVGSVGIEDARRILDLAADLGVNLIDTADIYADGESESVLGQILSSHPEMLVATKVGLPRGPGPNQRGNSRRHIIRSCEASLRRLNRDHIDLYQLHQWDAFTPLEETLDALDSLVKSGKVRYIGCSNFTGWQLMKTMYAARMGGFPPLSSQQIHYSAQAREAELELLPAGADQGVGALVWSPLAGGLLSGKFARGQDGPEQSRHHARRAPYPPVYDENKLFEIVEAMVEIAENRGCSAAQVALSWLSKRPGVSSVIVGGRSVEQFQDSLAAATLVLSSDENSKIELKSRGKLPYPHWHHVWTISDRLGSAERIAIGDHIIVSLE